MRPGIRGIHPIPEPKPAFRFLTTETKRQGLREPGRLYSQNSICCQRHADGQRLYSSQLSRDYVSAESLRQVNTVLLKDVI